MHDVPLIAENNLAGTTTWWSSSTRRAVLQLDRLTRLRGMSEEQAEARMAAQASQGGQARDRGLRDRQLGFAERA